jgi:hypothetical protein
LCTDYIYLHLFPNQKDTINVKIETSYVNDRPCEGLERDLRNYCYMMDEHQCLDNCLLGCSLLHCFDKSGKRNERFSVCLPTSTPQEERDTRCSAYEGATLTSWEHCKAPQEDSSFGTGWIAFLSLGLPVLCFVVGSVFFYRVELHRKGRPPYEVPRWMPQWLFPRPIAFGRSSERMQELVG